MENKKYYKVLASEAGILLTPSEDGQVPHGFINNAKDDMHFDYRTVDEKETGKKAQRMVMLLHVKQATNPNYLFLQIV